MELNSNLYVLTEMLFHFKVMVTSMKFNEAVLKMKIKLDEGFFFFLSQKLQFRPENERAFVFIHLNLIFAPYSFPYSAACVQSIQFFRMEILNYVHIFFLQYKQHRMFYPQITLSAFQ